MSAGTNKPDEASRRSQRGHEVRPVAPQGFRKTGTLSGAASQLASGVLVGQMEAPGSVIVGRPEGRRPLVVELSANAARTRLSFLSTLRVEDGAAAIAPLGGVLLERVDDLSVVAQLTDEAFLSTQTAAEDVGAGKLDHLGQKRSQFPIDHLLQVSHGVQVDVL